MTCEGVSGVSVPGNKKGINEINRRKIIGSKDLNKQEGRKMAIQSSFAKNPF